ncbi:hypothetical protein [Aliamphritea spongicola]|nr:hypothetical protein [Aliamphritea spongicola]
MTGGAEFMYQNVTFIPLFAADGEVTHICMIVYDVTDTAVHKQGLQKRIRNWPFSVRQMV